MLSEERKQELIETLLGKFRAKGRSEVCPMCGNDHFVLADEYLVHVLQSDSRNVSLSGRSLPTIAIICSNCGFVSQHAIGALGLLEKQETP